MSQHLHALETKGYIHRGREKSRAIRVLDGPDSTVPATGGKAIPLLMRGRVVAGDQAVTADAPGTSYLIDRMLFEGTGNFLMRVQGECMVDTHILSGDMIVVSPQKAVESGDVVVARVNGETSVKRYEASGNLRRLVSDTGAIAIDATVQIMGRVVGLIRTRC